MQSYRVGRSRACNVRLNDESISREHALIVPRGDNAFELSDDGSTHGTFIEEDGAWVEVTETVVVSGDVSVMLGRFQTTIGDLLINHTVAGEPTEGDPYERVSRRRRRLAAIVAMDVVGYSAQMHVDETRTLAVLRDVRSGVLDPCLEEFGGRIFKEIGDGFMLEFNSVNDSVMFAVEIQRMMIERNAKAPEHRRMEFRIGINVGDVIVQGDDLMGEGVNIAARLEPMAETGGICLSGVVRDLVKAKLDLGFKSLGDQKLKNIADPVRVYALGGTAESSKRTKPKKKGFLPI
jgi:class 3 adenylate cyclase